jgi:hypothetical protein
LRKSIYPGFAGHALLLVARQQVRRWDRALARVELEQERVLASILKNAENAAFGRRHRFAALKGYADFAREVPLGDYDSFSPYIDRMRSGERNLLVPEFVQHFGNSSGSSTQGRSKFLPISTRQVAEQRRAGADVLMRYLAAVNDVEFTRGFTLGLFPPTTMRHEGPTLVTSNPALMVTKMPAFTRPVYLPHEDIKQMGDYEKKLVLMAERYLDWDVRAVAGTTCWFSLLFDRVLDVAKRRGIPCAGVADLWPNLRVLLGGGVSAEPYLPILRRQLGRDDVTLLDTYNATEGGIYGASDLSGGRGLLMLPHRGTFFEFVPLDHKDSPRRRVPLWMVERDRLYSIVVTTTSGLYAYELGDIVRFPSTEPLRIEFVGRLAGCLSVTQELTTHIEIEKAVTYAAKECAARTVDFGAAAEFDIDHKAKSRYVLFVEFDEGAAPRDLDQFASAFDEGLQRENRVYREHRGGDVAILPPRVELLMAGGAKRFLDEITGGNVQGKFPRILDEARKSRIRPHLRGIQNDA